ncbi:MULTISPECIES: response regulator [unclassified Tenacibaculum]|uniref:response regulator n=1 Tax=Tenacibaculum TaxID=104267 RepID=UPI001F16863F|nr:MULTISPECIES: response regulator [unclassified Tenacibaculum]MCF2875176.1 response regulator [Tenacibaculum sp. Cn5-1]MCF2935252.1 response regulator [Tenacibaculum sp. Cn5-34]MCG7511306.1 response regulator [Tenacibaculum sp. Cn5-46]
MKILAIDDQRLVLIPLENRLKELGYEIQTEISAVKGIELFDSFKPDLVIVDMNMPTISGLGVIKHIREVKKSDVPVMVLSGNTDDDVITEGFDLGINDYMKKPLSLNEVCARVKRLIGVPEKGADKKVFNDTIIQQRCVGVVIPCYNEEERLLSKEFINFIDKHTGYLLCFVNDGSTDKTLDVLNNLRKGREDFISVYDCEKNGGKAEAVRLGMLHLAEDEGLDYIGFLDADLSTDLSDFDDLVTTIENSDFKIVSGSRISRMGANITKQSARQIISLTINYIIRKILSMNFKDTQCGAKIFHRDVINIAFDKKFITKWLFDVEIFLRVKRYYKIDKAREMMCEQPLKRWVHADGSKLSMRDSIRIIGQLGQIAWSYRKKNIKNTKNVTQPKFSIKSFFFNP